MAGLKIRTHPHPRLMTAFWNSISWALSDLTKSLVLALAVVAGANGATFIWNDTASDFNSAGSWIPLGGASGAPGSGDRALFPQNPFSFTPNITTSTSVGGIELSAGAGALSFSASAGTTLTLGSNGLVNYAGNAMTLNSADISLALGSSSTFTGDGTIAIGSLIGGFSIGGHSLVLNGSGTASSISVAISGASGSLAKSGTGTWTLSATNTYTGSTQVSGGVLAFSSGANASTSIATSGSGVLQLGAANVFPSATSVSLGGGSLRISGGAFGQNFSGAFVSLTANSTLDFGSGLGATAVVFGDSSAQPWTGTLTISNFNTAGGDTLRFGTNSSGLTGGQLASISFDGTAAQIDASGFVTPVPEPATVALMLGAAAAGVVGWRRRRGVAAVSAA